MTALASPPPVSRREPATYYSDHMGWRPQFDRMRSGTMESVLAAAGSVGGPEAMARYDARDVRRAIASGRRTPEQLAALLSPAALPLLDELVAAAAAATREHFGARVALFTPLYVSNYCQNTCTYCGFRCTNKIARVRLDEGGIAAELDAIAATGLTEVLILTGESAKWSDAAYIARAVAAASERFDVVGIEVQPLSIAEYRLVRAAGATHVSIYQETYDPVAYERYHPTGYKRHFPYRFESAERALAAGFEGASFGALLGLSDFRRDAFCAALHGSLVSRRFPDARIGFSVPRIRPIVGGPAAGGGTAGGSAGGSAAGVAAGGGEPAGGPAYPGSEVDERDVLQVLCAYRLAVPDATITISTRESAAFRDSVLGVIANKVSAGVSTGVGEHADDLNAVGDLVGDAQFEIADDRTVDQMCAALRGLGLTPTGVRPATNVIPGR